VRRELPKGILLDVAYLGSKGIAGLNSYVLQPGGPEVPEPWFAAFSPTVTSPQVGGLRVARAHHDGTDSRNAGSRRCTAYPAIPGHHPATYLGAGEPLTTRFGSRWRALWPL